jgi:hypothetical protein
MAGIMTADLSERQWQLAHIVAQQLVLEDADANELGKAKAYLRAIADQSDGGQRFFRYLQTLAKQGDRIGHSKKTKNYFTSMSAVCEEHLQDGTNKPESLQIIIGWAFRLMRYYKDGVPPDSLKQMAQELAETEVLSERQAEIAQVMESVDIQVGTILDAEIINIKRVDVTYQFLGAISKTNKEHRKVNQLSIGQKVKVMVTELKDDGTIKKVKLSD